MKTVQIVAHSFDCLPSDVSITRRGTGTTIQVATVAAIRDMFRSDKLRHKRINDFKISLVVLADMEAQLKN